MSTLKICTVLCKYFVGEHVDMHTTMQLPIRGKFLSKRIFKIAKDAFKSNLDFTILYNF